MEKLERVKRRVLTIIREIEKRMESGEFEPMPAHFAIIAVFVRCVLCGRTNIKQMRKKVPDERLSQTRYENFLV